MMSLVGETNKKITNAGKLHPQLYLTHHVLNHLHHNDQFRNNHRHNNVRDHVCTSCHGNEHVTGVQTISTKYFYEDDSSKHQGGLIDLRNHLKDRPLLEVRTSCVDN